jgi:hypothetical protein
VSIYILLGLVALILFGALQILYTVRFTAGRRPRFRIISVFNALHGQMGRAIESGKALHVSVGTGGISGEDTATTLAGLSIVEFLSGEAAASGIAPVITTSDPTALLLAQDILRRPHIRQGDLSGYQPLSARLLALNPTQYAVATMDLLAHDQVSANVMLGGFGPEIGLIEHETGKQALSQLTGAADPRALALMTVAHENVLIGEEIFAAKAYLQARPQHLASLRAQDVLRWLVVFFTTGWFVLNLIQQTAR